LTENTVVPGSVRSISALRELQAAREIAHAFIRANVPVEVYNLALERVGPLIGAAFGSVFLREDESDLLRVVATHNWPGAYASYLSEMRVRIGAGPTGQAVAENRVVEVSDVFADPELEDWHEIARELGYSSTVALPLVSRGEAVGAVTFYFAEPEALRDVDRSLLQLVADQLAATAEKAYLIEDLQRANALLREQNVELEARFREAAEAQRLKSEFLANVSHELRTPLTAVLGYSYLLREGLSGPLASEQVGAVEKIETAAHALMGLINDLLDLTHLRLGRVTIERDAVDAAALARSALSATPPPASDAVEVKSEVPTDPVRLETDPGHVLRILQNLLSNALKFTLRGTVTLRVRTVEPGGEPADAAEPPLPIELGRWGREPLVLWEVADTGIGIEPDDLDAIFDEFRQVDGSATRRFGGTGLGLALGRGLARSLGGDILVRSAPGQGTTFTLVLPRTPPAEAPSAPETPPAPPAEPES
jgi:signal transduction histidine kinase